MAMHDRECLKCTNLFSCPGKPEGCTECIKFCERIKKDGREKNVFEKDRQER